MCGNEIKPEDWRHWVFISIAMYPVIRMYDDTSEQSEKNKNYREETASACSKSRHC